MADEGSRRPSAPRGATLSAHEAPQRDDARAAREPTHAQQGEGLLQPSTGERTVDTDVAPVRPRCLPAAQRSVQSEVLRESRR